MPMPDPAAIRAALAPALRPLNGVQVVADEVALVDAVRGLLPVADPLARLEALAGEVGGELGQCLMILVMAARLGEVGRLRAAMIGAWDVVCKRKGGE
jgi:hypothetical protein